MSEKVTWRVVLEDGTIHEVTARETECGLVVRRADGYGHNIIENTMADAREGVTRICSRNGWPVREILAPGERSRAEIIESVLSLLDKQEAAMLLASKSACESRQPAFHAAANAYAHAAAVVRKETGR